MRVEVAPPLPFSMDEEEVAVEDGIEPTLQDPAVADRDQPRLAGGGDVEPIVDATAAARRVVLPDRSPHPMRALDREDVTVVRGAAVAIGDREGRRCR